jgi:CheY-like chemotaxis protein
MFDYEELKNYSVIYIEDDDITREMAVRMLSKHFKAVDYGENGLEGLELYRSKSPDIIITDLSMPVKSGFEMINEIRKSNKEIPIIVTTAYRKEAEAVEADVDCVVYKPVNKKVLLKALAEVVAKF